MSKSKKHETNEQIVARLMKCGPHGAMNQLFIIEAISRYAEQCAEADAKDMDSGLINGEAWKRTAVYIRDEMNKKYGKAAP